MTAAAALQIVLQMLALAPTVAPAVVKAVEDFKAMFADGNEPTQADIDALLDRIKAQSAAIQNLDDKA